MKKFISLAVLLSISVLSLPKAAIFAETAIDPMYPRIELTAEQKEIISKLKNEGDMDALVAQFKEWGIEMPGHAFLWGALTTDQKKILQDLKQMNDPEEMRKHMMEYAQKHDMKVPELTSEQIALRDALKAAVETNDYEAFKKAVAGTPLEQMTQSDFDGIVKLHVALSSSANMKPEDMRMTLTKEQKMERRDQMREKYPGLLSFFKHKRLMSTDESASMMKPAPRGFFARLFAPKNY